MCNLENIIRTASESFGRWSVPHRTRLSDVLVFDQVKKTCFYTFFYCIKCRYTLCNHSLSINSLPNHTILSHPLLLFLQQPWFSIVGLSKKASSLKIYRYCMNGQWGSGAMVSSSHPHLSSSLVSPPTTKLLVCPMAYLFLGS